MFAADIQKLVLKRINLQKIIYFKVKNMDISFILDQAKLSNVLL